MKKITLLIGLPGSGKSTYLKLNNLDNLDDTSQTDPGLKFLQKKLENDNDLFIADVNFCDPFILDKAINKIKSMRNDVYFNFILFSVEKNICFDNIKSRNDGRYVLPSLERFDKTIQKSFIYIKENNYNYISIDSNYNYSKKLKP